MTEVRCHVVEGGRVCGGESLAPPSSPNPKLVTPEGTLRVEGMCHLHALEATRRQLARLSLYEVQLMYLVEDQGELVPGVT